MNVGRAMQIAQSGQDFNITYDGIPVQIQHVDEKSGTARIYAVSDPDYEYVVSVDSLSEE